MKRPRTYDRTTIADFWHESMRDRWVFAQALLHPFGSVCLSVLAPFFVGKVLAELAVTDGNPTEYLPYLALVATLGVLGNRFGFKGMMKLIAKSMYRLQIKVLDTLLGRSTGFHANNVGGKLVSEALDYPTAFHQLSAAFFLEFMPFLVVLLIGSVLVFTESVVLGLLVAGMSAMVVAWAIINSRRRSELRYRRMQATKKVTSHLADTITNIQAVKTFAHEDNERRQNATLGNKLLELRLHDWQLVGTQGSNRLAALMSLQFVFIITIIQLVRNDPSLLGVGIFAFSYTILLSNRLFQVDTMLRTIEEALLQAAPMTETILQEPEITDRQDAQPLQIQKGAIDLDEVHFHYQDDQSKQAVFSALNLHIKPGEKIGLVGPSGGGKSTLTRLLLRFEDIDSGQISIDGQNITAVTQDSLRRSIAYVPQEPLLFHRSVSENIAYGKDNAVQEDIVLAAGMAHADGFIETLPKGYATVVGERGVKLSGGQRQRIAIARAFLKDTPILLLDEATSALDSESEILIQDALWKMMEDRTAIVIAHRLSTIQKMDRIIVMDDGHIIEEGTHRQLLRKKGLYAKLWAHQSGGFLEE